MIHILHGFLGSPEDFTFLNELGDIRFHDLYSTTSEKMASEISADDILVGYSMGGRLALEIAHQKEFSIGKLILINSHPGLPTEEEKKQRRTWENDVLRRLTTAPQSFLDWWNTLPVFEHDRPLQAVPEDRLLASIDLFEKLRLSQQQDFLPHLIAHKDKVMWIVGDQDQKYKRLAQERLASLGIPYRLCSGGHRLFQNTHELLTLLKEEIG